MKEPIAITLLQEAQKAANVADLDKATIRQSGEIARYMENRSGVEFLHLEMGIPGMKPEEIGIQAQCKALEEGVASIYPNMMGIPQLKTEASRFLKAFVDVDVAPQGCIPTVGSMQGSFSVFMLLTMLDKRKDTILFIDPGFPVQRTQTRILGIKSESFDIYDHRAEKLHDKLESYLKKGNIAGIIYSNPNNPAWVCMTASELRTIGELATKYDAVVVEDLAYLCMDFRQRLGNPFEAPFQPSVAKYTDNYILLVSGSKIFSYAGERIGVAAIPEKLFGRTYPALEERCGMARLGDAYVLTILYSFSSGASHSAQYALAAMFKAAADGDLDFVGKASEYARRAKITKDSFLRHGFHLVYDKDLEQELSDGFFYTVGYRNMSGTELMRELLLMGIASISLSTTGSKQDGVRICVSQLNRDSQFEELDQRLKIFYEHHKK